MGVVSTDQTDLLGLDRSALQEYFASLGEKSFHARQVLQWIYQRGVTNFSEMTHRRIYWKIGVEYRTSIDQLRTIREGIEAYIMGNDSFAKPPQVPTFVRIDSFSDSSIDILLYCFTRTTVWGEWLAIKEDLAYEIKQIVEGAGSGFAFPSQSLYVEALPGQAAEVFVPPTTPSAP